MRRDSRRKAASGVATRRGGSAASSVTAYKNPVLAPEKRVKDLLSRMTIQMADELAERPNLGIAMANA
jgi:hypothetical protein